MPVYGIELDRCNPEFTLQDFLMFMPQFKTFMATDEGLLYYNNLYPMANNKIFYSIFGTDWKYAMSLCICHYMYLISKNAQGTVGDSITSIAAGQSITGVLTSVGVGGYSKTYDFQYTMLNNKESAFWNQSNYGMQLMALYATKYVPSIFIVNKDTSYLPPDGASAKGKYDYLLNDHVGETTCHCNCNDSNKEQHSCFKERH